LSDLGRLFSESLLQLYLQLPFDLGRSFLALTNGLAHSDVLMENPFIYDAFHSAWRRSSHLPDDLPMVEPSVPAAEVVYCCCALAGDGDRNPRRSVVSVMMRSVDDWPLAKILHQISGGKPG
jgi:hypothetical protein